MDYMTKNILQKLKKKKFKFLTVGENKQFVNY